jgi:hypothetical protein
MRRTLPAHIAKPPGPDALSVNARKGVCGSERYVKRQREPGEATGPEISVMAKKWPIYKPPVWDAPIR